MTVEVLVVSILCLRCATTEELVEFLQAQVFQFSV